MTLTRRALVVDDSTVMCLLVRDALEQAGFTVTTAENGSRAVALLDSGPFQLIVTDLNMPVMDGLEFIRHARRHAEHRYAPIVLLTTERSQTKVRAGSAVGATAWLAKPFERDKLYTIVSRVVR